MSRTRRNTGRIGLLPEQKGADKPAPATEFPLRVAGIDIGSNAMRLMAMHFDGPDTSELLCSERAAVRLGHDVFLSGRLSAHQMDAAIDALRGFKEQLTRLGIRHCRMVATSAVREAKNGEAFAQRVEQEVGLPLDVISGSEEARLIHRAVRTVVPMEVSRWILADLGGGSVEVSLADAGGILWSESHTIGSVRLLEELSSSGEEPGRFRQLLAEQVNTLRVPSSFFTNGGVRGFIATGGNIEALARLADPTGTDVPATLPLERLGAIIEKLAGLSYHQRVDELKLKQDRADVILPAALVYERLCVGARQEAILVPFVGLKDGIIFDLLDNLSGLSEYTSRRDHEIFTAAVNLGRRYMFDESHGMHVARLALTLFDQLSELHGLGNWERRLLLAAAVLHDIGQYVSYKRHHKHSLYLISQSELAGFSERRMLLAGNVARYHRKSEPASHHEPFMRLDPTERRTVTYLGAILRLADALDREHQGRVQRIEAQVKGKDLLLRLEGEGDMLLERWVLRKKCEFFNRVFQLKVKLAD